MQLDISSIDAGLGYCRWLESKAFCSLLKAIAPSAPRHHPPVLRNNNSGKRVYEMVAKHISSPSRGGILLQSGEIKAVRNFLYDLKDSAPRGGAATSRSPIKHAKLQLNSISKFMSGGKRTIRGVANSGLTDRVGDVVEPKGGRWSLPVPLLWQHKHDQPIGWVREIDARSDGLWITAELATGIGKADEAWAMIEAGLVDSYSIGFQSTDWSPLPGGGKRFTSWDLLEISVVTIPADAAAKIRRSASNADAPLKRSGAVRLNQIPNRPGSVRLIRGDR